MFSLLFKLQRVLAGLGPKLAITNKKVGKGKLGFMAMEADRTVISFHMYLLPFLCILSVQVQLSKRRETNVSVWQTWKRDLKHVEMGQLKRNSSKADRPSTEVSLILQRGPYSMPRLGRGQRTKRQAVTQPITSAKLKFSS